MNSGRKGPQGGVILFEVMLATAIFCLVGVAFTDGLGRVADSIRHANRENQIRIGLESRLAEARVLPIDPGLHREKPDAEGVTYEREWKIVRLLNKDKAVLPGLYLLTIRAHWTEDNRENVEESSIRVYRPQS